MAPTDLLDRSSQRALPLWLPVVVAVLIVARVISSRFPVKSPTDLVRWVSLETAERTAAASRKPIFYDFSAEWCGPCHRMDDEIFHDPQLAAEINEKFVPVRVVDRQRETGRNPPAVARLQSLYAVGAFPTLVVARRGRAPATMVGYGGRSAFEQFVGEIR